MTTTRTAPDSIMPPFDPLEVQIAAMICKRRQNGTVEPSMASIHAEMPFARKLIAAVRAADQPAL